MVGRFVGRETIWLFMDIAGKLGREVPGLREVGHFSQPLLSPYPVASQARHEIVSPYSTCASRTVVLQLRWKRGRKRPRRQLGHSDAFLGYDFIEDVHSTNLKSNEDPTNISLSSPLAFLKKNSFPSRLCFLQMLRHSFLAFVKFAFFPPFR
jgi:hypothetical protein